MNKFDFIANRDISKDKIEELIKKDVFIEKVTTDDKDRFLCSDIVKPTPEQILEFINRGCVHDLNKDKLVYDEQGWLYDSRFCALCGKLIGQI